LGSVSALAAFRRVEVIIVVEVKFTLAE